MLTSQLRLETPLLQSSATVRAVEKVAFADNRSNTEIVRRLSPVFVWRLGCINEESAERAQPGVVLRRPYEMAMVCGNHDAALHVCACTGQVPHDLSSVSGHRSSPRSEERR